MLLRVGCSPPQPQMRRVAGKLLVLSVLLILFVIQLGATEIEKVNSTRVCRSQGGRFLPYATHGEAPRRVRGSDALSLCRAYKWETCCSKEQTDAALIRLRKLATSGEAGADCLALWEVVECSICDPYVGSSEGPAVICQSLCDKLLDACREAFFTLDSVVQDLVPCGRHDLICTRASEWASSGAQFCKLLGYQVADEASAVSSDGAPVCFDGKRIPAPGDHKGVRHEKKKQESGFWDVAKKVRRKAGKESGVGFPLLVTGMILLLWVGRKYWQRLGLDTIVFSFFGRRRQTETRNRVQEARRKQQLHYDQGLKPSVVPKGWK